MPDTTTIQSLPLIQPSQAQKHVTHNEALKILDLIVQMTVESRTLSVAPSAPVLGASHIVAAGATGAWAGHDGAVATFTGIVWEFYPPKTGWTAYVVAEGHAVVYDGTNWGAASEGPAVFARLGVSASPDATNRLTVSSPASLFGHDGAGHQMKIDKATSADGASLLLQTAGSGRAELGTVGSDALTLKVSSDGATYHEGLRVTAGTGTANTVLSGSATPSGSTKTVEIGTGGEAGSVTAITLGSGSAGALGTTTIMTPTVTFAPSVTAVAMGNASLGALYAGIGGAAGDATNRLAVSAPATLLNNAGAGHQLKINKAAPTDTASLMFQTGFSGRAEMGTAGSDDFAIKVSADGSSFAEALTFDAATGRTRVQNGLRLTPAAGDLVGPVDGEVWYDSTAAKFRARQDGSSVDLIGSGGGATFSDADFAVQDDGDPTKQLKFQVGGLPTATVRTLTLPGADGTIATLAGVAQTFVQTTTFSGNNVSVGTSPSSSTYGLGIGATASGNSKTINIGSAGLAGSTTTISLGSAAPGTIGTTTFHTPSVAFGPNVTAVNLPDGATFFTDNLDPAKRLQFDVGGITSGSTRTVTAPDASGTLVLAAAAQTLTNKTIDLAANTLTGSLPAASVAMAGGGTVQDYAGFSTRAGFVAWASGKTPTTGSIIDAAGFSYRYTGAGTAIGDLPGWVPLGYAFPDHWAQNVTPGTTNMHGALTSALGYSATVYLAGGNYAVGSTVAWDNATLIGNNDRGTARTKIVGLSALIPVGQAIVAPGRSATMRGIQLGYDSLTGTETQDQRVGLDTRGLSQVLQRGSVIDEVVIENVGTGISDFGAGEFSVTYGTLEIGSHSFRAVDIRGTTRTGSVWLNLYINGGATYTPEGGFCLTGQGAGGVIGQLNIEHAAYAAYPVRFEGLQGLSISSLHIEGVDCVTAGFGYVGLDSASVTIQSLNVTNTRMSADDTAVVRLARAGYQSAVVSPLLATASASSNLKIGKLHVKGLASPSNTLYPAYPVERTGVRNCAGFNLFKRDAAYTDTNWSVEVQDYLWAAFAAQSADQPFLEFPDLTYSGQIEVRRMGVRGSGVVPFENYVQNGAFDKWLAATATVTSGAQEVANKWTLRGAAGSATVDRVQDDYGAVAQYDARVTVTAAGTAQSWDHDIAFPVEWLGQTLRLSFDMKAAVAGRVLDQITATLHNGGGGVPATVTKQVLSGSNAKLDATTAFKTYVLDFAAVDGALVTTLGTAAVMRLSFVINGTSAVRTPTVTFAKVALSKMAGARFARAPYDRLALTTADVAGLGALATAGTLDLTTQATGLLQAAQMPAQSGDVVNSAGSLVLTIGANVVTNAKLAEVATATIKGRATAGTGAVEDMTGTQTTALLDIFTTGAKGLAPASGGGTATYLRADGTWSTPPSGGTPGGATTQMQFNNAGTFAGASEVLVENNQLRLPVAASFAAPASGGARMVGRADAGRTLPAFLSQDGNIRDLQTSLARSSALVWKAQAGSNVLSTMAGTAPTAVGTATATTVAVTSLVTYTPRLEYLVTAASATAVAGFRTTSTTVTVGGASAGLGGFTMVGRWGPATGVATATHRAFFGVASVTSAPTDVEPSTVVNCVAMGWDAADTNVQMMSNDASGTCTKVDLGASFPVPTTDRAALYELSLFSPKSTTQSVAWQVTDLVSGAVASGTITTDMPGTATLLAPRGWLSVGGTSSVIGFGLASMVLDPLL